MDKVKFKVPSHWEVAKKYKSLSEALEDFKKKEEIFEFHEVNTKERLAEWSEVEQLMQRTWRSNGQNTDRVEVIRIERVENPAKLQDYYLKKQGLAQSNKSIVELQNMEGSSGPVQTDQHLKSFLSQNIDVKANEHYLFHGTMAENKTNIARDGLDIRYSSETSLLGFGIYTAESSTKSDGYTDQENKHMFLVRVLLGEPFINKITNNPPKFERPPCKKCHLDTCTCTHSAYLDSVIDDSGRPFREFVVYDSNQAYPEYVIKYRIVKHTFDLAKNPPQKNNPTPTIKSPEYDNDCIKNGAAIFGCLVSIAVGIFIIIQGSRFLGDCKASGFIVAGGVVFLFPFLYVVITKIGKTFSYDAWSRAASFSRVFFIFGLTLLVPAIGIIGAIWASIEHCDLAASSAVFLHTGWSVAWLVLSCIVACIYKICKEQCCGCMA